MLDRSSFAGDEPATRDDGNSDNPGEGAGNREEADNDHDEPEDCRDGPERVKRPIGLLPSREAANRVLANIPTESARHGRSPFRP